MKKLLLALFATTLIFTLAACGESTPEVPEAITMDMEDFDTLLDRNDMQFVDLRNFDDQMRGGWVRGFEIIPFFMYLEYEDVLVRTNGWTFEADAIKNEIALRALFDEDKHIVLICAAGVRAGFVKEALEHLGYENVYNAGALGDYEGERLIAGDDSFRITMPTKGDYTPGQYVGVSVNTDRHGNSLATTAMVIVNNKGGIQSVFIDVVHPSGETWTTKQALGDDYAMKAASPIEKEWYEQVNTLAQAIVNNQGWSTSWTIDEDNYFADDAVAGVTVRVTAYQAAVLDALAQAAE